MAAATTSQTLRAMLDELAEQEQRPWMAGEWERTEHHDPPGPGWSARADDAVAAVAAGREEPAGHWRYARGDGYPLDVGAPFEQPARMYVVPNHATAAHVGTSSGYRMTVEHRGRAYSAHPSLHMFRHGDEWHDWRQPAEDDASIYQRAGQVPSTLYGCDDMPKGAQDRVRAAIVDAFRGWAAEHPEAFEHAQTIALNNAAHRRDREIAAKAKELAELLAELDEIEAGAEHAPTY